MISKSEQDGVDSLRLFDLPGALQSSEPREGSESDDYDEVDTDAELCHVTWRCDNSEAVQGL